MAVHINRNIPIKIGIFEAENFLIRNSILQFLLPGWLSIGNTPHIPTRSQFLFGQFFQHIPKTWKRSSHGFVPAPVPISALVGPAQRYKTVKHKLMLAPRSKNFPHTQKVFPEQVVI